MITKQLALSADHIRKSYYSGDDRLDVLSGVSLRLYAGDMAILQGASGTGKSTLLHILGTLDRPDSGEVSYGEIAIAKMNHGELARFRNQKIGFVYQFHHLLPEFSALENVMLPGLIIGLSKKTAAKIALELLTQVGLAERAGHRPNQLSGGEAQRVAVARALFNKPMVVYADEPTGNLDNKTGEALSELFERLNRGLGQTFLIATHNERLMERINKRFIIKDGLVSEAAVSH